MVAHCWGGGGGDEARDRGKQRKEKLSLRGKGNGKVFPAFCWQEDRTDRENSFPHPQESRVGKGGGERSPPNLPPPRKELLLLVSLDLATHV